MKQIKAFIQNPIGSKLNYQYNEESFEFLGTDEINGTYPFPYGFIPNTLAEDGDCADCFVITKKKLDSGSQHNLVVIGLMEVWENEEEDHKLLLKFLEEKIDFGETEQSTLREFEENIFSKIDNRVMKIGEFLDSTSAKDYLERCLKDNAKR